MTKKNEIVSIEMDKPKKEKKDNIEIILGDFYMRIPRESKDIQQAINILSSFVEEEVDEEEIEEESEEEQPLEVEQEPIREEKQEVVIENPEKLEKCPICNGKLKKKSAKVVGNQITQLIKCKKRKCPFEREYKYDLG